jgi:rubrerythrin
MTPPSTAEDARRITPQSFDHTVLTFATLPPIETPQDLFSVALAMEREAVMRYAELADRMELSGDMGLAALFRGLQTEESGHEYGVTAWIERNNLIRRDTVRFHWDLPEAMTQAAGEAAGDGLNRPWMALAMALRNEERSFAFYAQVARDSADRDIQPYAESMAREELGHVLLLRLQRRAAWRAERAEREELAGSPPRPQAPGVAKAADLRALACAGETACAAAFGEAARRLRAEAPEDPATARLLEALAAEAAGRADGLGAVGEDIGAPDPAEADGQDPPARRALRAEARRAAASFDSYMQMAEATRDEEIRRAAQAEAEVALARLARLRDRLCALADTP